MFSNGLAVQQEVCPVAPEAAQGTGKPHAAASGPVIAAHRVVKTYPLPAGDFTAIAGVDLRVEAGELVTVVGRSGSGKTTLLNLLAGIDRPTAGEVLVAGQAVQELRGSRLAAWRGRTIGLVFQFFQLLPTLTVAENVMLPMDFCATFPPRQRRPRALGLLERVGIVEQADKLPSLLSVVPSAASSSAPRSPGRWPTTRRCCWPTSPPATSTRPPATASWACSRSWPPRGRRCCWSPTSATPPATPPAR
jgi:ABC-type glutathione transport system ATPase component